MVTTLNIDLSFMSDAVAKLDDDARMQQMKDKPSELNFNIKAGNADVGIFSRKSSGQFDENNRIRQTLINALKTQFGVKSVVSLPESVKHALKLDSWRDDFKFDADGNVTSGRPLTARRIKAVLGAVNSELNINKGIDKAWKTLSQQAELENRLPKRDVLEYFVEKTGTIQSSKLDLFDDGIDADVFSSFSSNVFKFEQSLYENMPERVSSAVEGGDGEIWRNVIADIVVGRLSEESRINLKRYVNSDECLQTMRAKYEDLASNNYSDEDFRELNGVLDYMAMFRVAVCDFYDMKAIDI